MPVRVQIIGHIPTHVDMYLLVVDELMWAGPLEDRHLAFVITE